MSSDIHNPSMRSTLGGDGKSLHRLKANFVLVSPLCRIISLKEHSIQNPIYALYLYMISQVGLQSSLGMETLLEQQRRYHEERERLMDGMVQVTSVCLRVVFAYLGIAYLCICVFRIAYLRYHEERERLMDGMVQVWLGIFYTVMQSQFGMVVLKDIFGMNCHILFCNAITF